MNNLKKYFSYKKLKSPPYKILFLNKFYFLQNESIQCFRNMGHTVLELNIVQDAKPMLDSILKSCVEFKPDFIFGMNHIGFDSEGNTSKVLDELNIPVVFWYLDDFRYIIKQNINLANSSTIIFTFEQNNLTSLQEFGFDHVFYLPSATFLNPQKNYCDKKYSFLNDKISFIGNTFEETKNNWFKPEYPELLNHLLIQDYFTEHNVSVVEFVQKNLHNKFEKLDELHHFSGYVSACLTKDYRKDLIAHLSKNSFDIYVYGDEKWKDFNLNINWNAAVNNTKIAPNIFAESQINLNISSTQLETAVNLRVFDVPASGGFLLTDWKENLAALFDEDKELATFKSKEELVDKIEFYIRNQNLADEIVRNAKERIHKDHLLQHRLQKILSTVKTVIGSN